MRSTARLFLLAGLVPLGGCLVGLAGVQGSGDIVTLEQDFANFSSVRAGSGARLTILPSDEFSVVVRIDENLQDYLDIAVEGSTLRIGMDSHVRFRNSHFEVDVMMPDIDAVRLSGGARGTVSEFDLDHGFDVRLSGGSRLDGTLTAAHLDVSASGGARAELAGSSASASLSGSGGSRISLAGWQTTSADVSMSGGSRGAVNATEALTGSVSGGARFSYVGAPPRVDVRRSGGGRVTQQ